MKTESEIKSIRTHRYYLKDLTNPPIWTEEEKKIIAWSICWEGSIGIYANHKQPNSPYPKIDIGNTDFNLLKEFQSIVRLGNISNRNKSKIIPNAKPQRGWQLKSTKAIYYLLKSILPYIPSQRKYKEANLVIEFIENKIKKGIEYKRSIGKPSKRQLEILQQFRRRPRYAK